jgi:hypothetical protein
LNLSLVEVLSIAFLWSSGIFSLYFLLESPVVNLKSTLFCYLPTVCEYMHCSLIIIIKNIKPRLIDCKHIEVISVCRFECVTYCYFRQRVLVIGGGGAVGLAAVQLAVAAGCSASATCGAQSMERVMGAGAEQAIDYTTEVKSLGCSCPELCC